MRHLPGRLTLGNFGQKLSANPRAHDIRAEAARQSSRSLTFGRKPPVIPCAPRHSGGSRMSFFALRNIRAEPHVFPRAPRHSGGSCRSFPGSFGQNCRYVAGRNLQALLAASKTLIPSARFGAARRSVEPQKFRGTTMRYPTFLRFLSEHSGTRNTLSLSKNIAQCLRSSDKAPRFL